MFGVKATLITGAAGLVVALTLAFLWKAEQVKVANLEGKITGLEGELSQALANTEILKAHIIEQRETFSTIAKLAEKNQERADELERERDEARAETNRAINEINSLRSTEADNAIAAPFERGNAARERFSDSVRRITGEKSGADPDSEHTNITRPGDT